jgi:hypothetical protein
VSDSLSRSGLNTIAESHKTLAHSCHVRKNAFHFILAS